MKTVLIAASLAIAAGISPVLAQQGKDSMKGMDMGTKPATTKQHEAKATVKSVDKKAGTVVLVHGPVATLNWPPMTMKFLVKDKEALDKLEAGKEVEVEFVQHNKDYVVTKVK
jgi:Cu(I)/Ag(I) efflux system periplasmic protein CusF